MRLIRLFDDPLARRGPGEIHAVHPVRIVPLGFLALIALGTALLSLPLATASGTRAPFLTALFTAVTTSCVNGLVTVDPGSFWSPFGLVVMMALMQVGGLGTLIVTTLLLLAVRDRLSLGTRKLAGAESGGVSPGMVEDRLRLAIRYALTVEALVALILAARLALGYGYAPGRALWFGLFHAISGFNNVGIGLLPDNLIGFASDPLILLPLAGAVVLGGIGLPVIAELLRHKRGDRWSIHLRLTLGMTAALIAAGAMFTFFAERAPGGALAGLSTPVQAMNAIVHSIMLRTGGYNAIDIARLGDGSRLLDSVLMVIGAGSGGTAGGIKVTTVAVLLAATWAQLRGVPETVLYRRRLSATLQREALAVTTIGGGAVVLGVILLAETSPFPLRDIMFEASSAFGGVGLSTGITGKLPPAAQIVLMALMFLGRVGPITLGAALALRHRPSHIRYPQERVSIG